MGKQAYLTVRDVARALREPVYRVKYAITSYDISPAHRIGIIRMFAPDQLTTIASAVHRVKTRKGAPLQ